MQNSNKRASIFIRIETTQQSPTCAPCIWAYADLAYFGGHRRYFLPPLSLYLLVIIFRWGTFLNFFAFFAPQAQRNTVQLIRTSSKASTPRSERNNASKQTELDRASISSRYLYSPLCSQNQPRNRNLPGLQNLQPFTKHPS